jgi:hypothetical protein
MHIDNEWSIAVFLAIYLSTTSCLKPTIFAPSSNLSISVIIGFKSFFHFSFSSLGMYETSSSIYDWKVSKDLLINSSASSSKLIFLRLPALCSTLSNIFLFFVLLFLSFVPNCSDLFSFVPDCSHFFSFYITIPTEFSPILREFLEILLDLQKSVFVSFLFTVELRYSIAKLRFLI